VNLLTRIIVCGVGYDNYCAIHLHLCSPLSDTDANSLHRALS